VRSSREEGLGREPKARVGLEEFRENILKIQELARQDGAECLFLTVPLRPRVPLVENFRAVRLKSGGAEETIWTRQIDFAVRRLERDARGFVTNHFFFGEDIASFTKDWSNCATVLELLKKHPDLPILHYLLAECYSRRGEAERAEAAMDECRRLDEERREMEAYNAALRGLAEGGLIEIVDAASTFEREENAEALFLDVVHLAPEGHALIARVLKDSIRARERVN
jgi:hypothetical protein